MSVRVVYAIIMLLLLLPRNLCRLAGSLQASSNATLCDLSLHPQRGAAPAGLAWVTGLRFPKSSRSIRRSAAMRSVQLGHRASLAIGTALPS